MGPGNIYMNKTSKEQRSVAQENLSSNTFVNMFIKRVTLELGSEEWKSAIQA